MKEYSHPVKTVRNFIETKPYDLAVIGAMTMMAGIWLNKFLPPQIAVPITLGGMGLMTYGTIRAEKANGQ